MPRGSTYTGIDFAENLIQEGQRLFAKQNIAADFICKNVTEYTAESQYDFVICQAVLRHLDNPDAFIRKMISFAKPEGYIVCMDVNREFESCGLYIDGMDYRELCLHEGLEKKWQTNALILQLLTHGLSRSEAQEYCLRNRKIAEHFASNPAAEYTFTRGLMIAYGRKMRE